MSELIQTERHGRVLVVRMHRPEKKNALTLAMYADLDAALRGADADEQIRAVVLAGVPGCFTSGNDISDFIQNPPSDEKSPVARFLDALVNFEKPLLAAVDGIAIGVGTTMLLHCDLVYAGAGTRLQMPFVNLALCPEAGSSLLLPRMMGHAKAAELLLFGEPFTPEVAREVGIVNEVVAAGQAEQRAIERASVLAAKAPGAVRISKRLLKAANRDELTRVMQAEFREFAGLLRGPEAMEALGAFMEKRAPDFSKFS